MLIAQIGYRLVLCVAFASANYVKLAREPYCLQQKCRRDSDFWQYMT